MAISLCLEADVSQNVMLWSFECGKTEFHGDLVYRGDVNKPKSEEIDGLRVKISFIIL